MNQDLRRMAEEVELPELPKPIGYYCNKCGKFPAASAHDGCNYLAVGMPRGFTNSEAQDYAREAIAAALVKLTQEQEPVGEVVKGQDGWPWVRFSEYQTSEVARLPVGTKLYTHPIPSQQEERKPLTEGTAAAHLRDLVDGEL